MQLAKEREKTAQLMGIAVNVIDIHPNEEWQPPVVHEER